MKLLRRGLLQWVPASLAGVPALQPAWAKCLYTTAPGLVKDAFVAPKGTHITYPHANGFRNAHSCVLALEARGQPTQYLAFDLQARTSRPLAAMRNARTYFAIAGNGTMAVPMAGDVSLVNLSTGTTRLLASFPGWHVLGDCDISPDGTKVLVNCYRADTSKLSRVNMIDTRSGTVTTLCETNYPLDHAHFSPFDPSWVFYCDGSPHARRRMWVWHATAAPAGRSIFPQMMSNGTSFDIGHERAMFNKLSLIVVAYADSSATPRGLYEIGFEGGVRCVSESNCDSHCNISHDGRWAVTSSLGPARIEASVFDECTRSAADWTRSTVGYVESDIAAVNMRTGERRFLYRGSNAVSATGASVQPYEAQPAISPDGRWVVFNDARQDCVVALEMVPRELERFIG